MHGGRVEVESQGCNRGTTFRIRLPVLQEPMSVVDSAPQQRLDAASAPKRRRVLVVDDNDDVLESLSRLVARLGNDVCRARDGLEAVDLAKSFRPEIVLMDLGMPNLNGYEAASRMRQEPWGQAITLVATSGWGQDGDRLRTAEAGFDWHLVKPIDTAALREVLYSPTPSRPVGSISPASIAAPTHVRE
jgi:CheY-like chemotaxis protein